MKFEYVTFLDAIPSPRTTNTNTTYGHDPKSFNGGYDLEERDGWIFVTWPGPNKDGVSGVTEVVHPSRVRNARVLKAAGSGATTKPGAHKATVLP